MPTPSGDRLSSVLEDGIRTSGLSACGSEVGVDVGDDGGLVVAESCHSGRHTVSFEQGVGIGVGGDVPGTSSSRFKHCANVLFGATKLCTAVRHDGVNLNVPTPGQLLGWLANGTSVTHSALKLFNKDNVDDEVGMNWAEAPEANTAAATTAEVLILYSGIGW